MSYDFELITNALKNLKRQGIRTFLTLLGVVIGVGAIVALLSIGTGLNIAINEAFESIGSNMIIIYAGNPMSMSASDIKINDNDIKHIENISGIDRVIGYYVTQGTIEYGGEKKPIMIMGSDAEQSDFLEDTGMLGMSEGSLPKNNSLTAAVIGDGVANDLFSKKITLRKEFKINDETFKVVGIMEKQQQYAGDPESGNNIVWLTLTGFKRLDPNATPLEIIATVDTDEDIDEIVGEIEEYFEDKYGERSIYVASSEQMLDLVNQLYGLITMVLIGIASISIIVGGIGIANAMVASVMERTKEIGLLKAIGGSDNKILTMFLLEAGFIGMIGGLVGITIGYGISFLVSYAAKISGFVLQSNFSIEIILGALLFSMFVGMISGYFPAKKAAKLDPVEALRYE
ncbi:MAG TPA: ABC transporter permease [archaeon]|nr:ABC transporter permease [archaeon]